MQKYWHRTCSYKDKIFVFQTRRVEAMADGEGGGAGNFVWAIALIIIVAIIAAVIVSGGFLTQGDKKIDVDIKAPAPAR